MNTKTLGVQLEMCTVATIIVIYLSVVLILQLMGVYIHTHIHMYIPTPHEMSAFRIILVRTEILGNSHK